MVIMEKKDKCQDVEKVDTSFCWEECTAILESSLAVLQKVKYRGPIIPFLLTQIPKRNENVSLSFIKEHHASLPKVKETEKGPNRSFSCCRLSCLSGSTRSSGSHVTVCMSYSDAMWPGTTFLSLKNGKGYSSIYDFQISS